MPRSPSPPAIPFAWRSYAYALLLAIVSFGVIRYQTVTRPEWPFDGYTYAIRAQMDAGASYDDARGRARALYAGKPASADPVSRRYLAAPYPQYWALFAPRVVYPWLASRLWPAFGARSLLIVSNVAFVAALLLLYALLLRYTRPGIALLLSLSCCALPTVRAYGSGATTDMTAFAFFVAGLYAMVRYAATGNRWWWAAYAAAVTLTGLTRPIPYIFVCAGVGLAVFGWRTRSRRSVRLAMAILGPAVVLCAAVAAIGAAARSPGLVEIVAQLRAGSSTLPSVPLWEWYAARVVDVALRSVAAAFALFAAPLGLLAFWNCRERADAAMLIGVLAASIATILLDPIVGDIQRVVIFPLLPIFCCGLALAATAALRHEVSGDAP